MAKTHTLLLTKDGDTITYDREPAAVLSTLRNGRYTVTITRAKEPRSLDQNALMWLWFSCISAETGTPVQDVHDYYCRAFLMKEIEWNGRREFIFSGTSKLSKERMTAFLDKVQADAAIEFGITLPNPEDRYFEAFYQTYK